MIILLSYCRKVGIVGLSIGLVMTFMVAEARAKTPESETGLYLVTLEDPPLARYGGGVKSLHPTSPAALGTRKVNLKSSGSLAYLGHLDSVQESFVGRARVLLGRELQVPYRFRVTGNSVVLRISAAEAARIATIDGVLEVIPDRVERTDTSRTPQMIGASEVWAGLSTGSSPGTRGEGVIVGIIDSGITLDHPSFAATDAEGYTHTNPNGSGVFVGWCDPANPHYSPSYVCNDKLIGAWDMVEPTCDGGCFDSDGPRDSHGHGTHVAGIAAGNILHSPDISGIAPRANIISYDVCGAYLLTTSAGTELVSVCTLVAIRAAFEQAVIDGVDVVNLSISGGTEPWQGGTNRAALDALAAGVLTVASAGNNGAGGEMSNLGPWVVSVGATTHDLVQVENQLIDMEGGLVPPATITGTSRTRGYGPASVVYAGTFNNGDPRPEQCLVPFPAGTWVDGEIVLCDRGDLARVDKCRNVLAGGAGGCILANTPQSLQPLAADAHELPAIHVSLFHGDALRTWLATGTGHRATITPSAPTLDPSLGDHLADFSSRGPQTAFDVLKPDLTAPGVDVFAPFFGWAYGPVSVPFYTQSGTSMAAPHLTGAAALLRALHPSWSPSQIKSALTLSAAPVVMQEDGVTPARPTERGAGRVDLTKAPLAGLIMDETAVNYLAADPARGGDPSSLNTPSVQMIECRGTCSATRRFESVASRSTSWNVTVTGDSAALIEVEPALLTLDPGEVAVLVLNLDLSDQAQGQFFEGDVVLTESSGTYSPLRFPVVGRLAPDRLPAVVIRELAGARDQWSETGFLLGRSLPELQAAVFGTVPATKLNIDLASDRTPFEPFDDLGQLYYMFVDVPAGAKRLAAMVETASAVDVDIYVGRGATVSQDAVICQGTTPDVQETCNVMNPEAGLHWILVQNWRSSAIGAVDTIELIYGVVDGSEATELTVSGPASIDAFDDLSLSFEWHSALFTGRRLGVVDLGSGPATPRDVASIPIDLIQEVLFSDGFESGDVSLWSLSVP